MEFIAATLAVFIMLASLVSAEQLPILPGSIQTLVQTSREVYEPHALRRSRFAADGIDAFILVDGSSLKLLHNPTGNNFNVTPLVGHSALEGYIDGPALDARFAHISDFAQSEDGRQIYISDQENHCIRLFDRDINNVTVIAGNCTQKGGHTGQPSEARFWYPTGLEISRDFSKLYIADRQNNRILRLNLGALSNETWVQTVVDNSMETEKRVNLPVSLELSRDGELMYISTENGIVSLANFSDSDLEPVRDRVSTIVKDGLDLVLTNNDKYLVVADLHGNRLVFIDLERGGMSQFCTGSLNHPLNRTDGSSSLCELNSPQAVSVVDDGSLFITELNSRVIRRVTYTVEDLTTTLPPTTTTPVQTTGETTKFVPETTRFFTRRTTQRYTGVGDNVGLSTPSAVKKSEADPLVLGLTVGIIVPLVLLGAVVGFIVYVVVQRKKQHKQMYARRTEQGGYAGPGGANNFSTQSLNNRAMSSASFQDQPQYPHSQQQHMMSYRT